MNRPLPRLVKVIFTERFPIDLVDSLLGNNFLGLGSSAYRHEDRRVIYVRPNPECYSVLIEQLNTWEREGRLSYEEQVR
jgi:hypothetical protein